MHWLQIIIGFVLGTFLGPWLMSMVTGKGKTGAQSGY
jgi:uncharacterized membrane-anchored protein YhcB (DUF1043 family)